MRAHAHRRPGTDQICAFFTKSTPLETKKASLKIRDFGLDVKAVNDDGTFSGYGSVFGVEDSQGEIVAPGAFAESLAEIAAKGRPVPVLWQHRSDQPIGIYSSLRETKAAVIANRGLAHLLRSESAGDEANAPEAVKALHGTLSGFTLPQF